MYICVNGEVRPLLEVTIVVTLQNGRLTTIVL